MTQTDQNFKADAGKLQSRLLPEGCPNALRQVDAVLTYGAQKYEAHSWKNVHVDRYWDAFYRHLNSLNRGELCDQESGLEHLSHALTNLLFIVEQTTSNSVDFKEPPQDHKN